jgi:hypothetical protein
MPINDKRKRRWVTFIALVIIGVVVFAISPARRIGREFLLSYPMTDAVRARDTSRVEHLLQRGASPNRPAIGGLMPLSPLVWATRASDIKMMKVLIKAGVNVDQQDGRGFTALMQASTPEASRLLLSAGADPSLKNDQGETALQVMKERSKREPSISPVIKVLEHAMQHTSGNPPHNRALQRTGYSLRSFLAPVSARR